MGLELEWKYAAEPPVLPALHSALDGPWRTLTMETQYLDGPGRPLAPLRWTLRRRMENGQSVFCLKTPGEHGARGEWQWPGDAPGDAPAALVSLGAPARLLELVDGATLVPVCGAAFTRQALVVDTGDSQVELALDLGTLSGGGHTLPLCEVEVEHLSGDPASSHRWAEALAVRWGLSPLNESKFVRANRLAGEPA